MIGPSLPFCDFLHATKYRAEGETYEGYAKRIALALSDDYQHEQEIFDFASTMRFMPAGRIQAWAGSPKVVTPYNCFVSPTIHDSFVDGPAKDVGRYAVIDMNAVSIMDAAKLAAQTMRQGGGIGYDFSTLRPAGDMIMGVRAKTDGPIAFMPIFNAVCQATSSAGERRGAQMGVLRCDHPDIRKFITMKTNNDFLRGFNVSVGVTDELMEAVARNGTFDLRFGGRVYQTVDACELWDLIMRTTWDWAEPGVIFLDTINRMNNLWYCETISTTNPCVPGDTPILTSKGYVDIESVVGQDTWIWNGEDWAEVTPFATGFNDTVVVNLSDGSSLRCTPAHEFCVWEGWDRNGVGKKVRAENLKPGDKLEKFNMPVVHEGITHYTHDAYSQGFYEGDGSAGLNRSFVYGPKLVCKDRLVGTFSSAGVKDAEIWNHGPMLQKGFVPVDATSSYCLEWLAGLIDSDGCATHDKNGTGFQICSINKDMLDRTRLMLTRLGVRAKVVRGHGPMRKDMPGGTYLCQQGWRLLIGNTDAAHLMSLGMTLSRVKHDGAIPQRDARQFVTVVSVEESEPCETFCFTEKGTGRGTFNGIVTGQCGEQPLPPYGACLLGSFALPKYLKRDLAGWYFDWEQFLHDIPNVVRMMDNVIDKATYPLPQQREEATSKRRMGLGVTGLANALEAMGMPYGSVPFVTFETKLMNVLRDEAYRASIALAKEKGAFKLFDAEKYLASGHNQMLPEDIRADIRKYGIRNSHLTSIAPTGTISFSADNMSGGIEPVFAWETERPVDMPGGKQVVTVKDYAVNFLDTKGRTTAQVTVDEHMAVFLAAAQYVDSAVSKTVNVDKHVKFEDFKDIYRRAYEGNAKGITTFNKDGKRFALLTDKDGDDRGTAETADTPEPMKVSSCEFDPVTGRRSCE